MKYLNYSNLPAFLDRYFSGPGMREQRLVGRDRAFDSGYYDIFRYFGEGALKPRDIQIKYLPRPFTFADPNIRDFSVHAEQRLRLEGRLYDGPTVMKLVGLELSTYPQSMTVQECSYGDQAGSCFALDLPHPVFRKWGGTLREYYKAKYPSTELDQNPLAICLGICGYLVVREGEKTWLLQVHRTGKLASLENSLGPSVAGSVDWVTGYANLEQLINKSLGDEVGEELNLSAGEYGIIPLAYAREIFRGEKPQLFCLVTTSLSREQVTSRLSAMSGDRGEFDRFEFVTIASERVSLDRWLETLNHEARMSYYLVEEYLDASSGRS